MNVPCRIRSLKYVKYGNDFEMSSGALAEVTSDSSHHGTHFLKVTSNYSSTIFTEKALKNAIKNGSFSLA